MTNSDLATTPGGCRATCTLAAHGKGMVYEVLDNCPKFQYPRSSIPKTIRPVESGMPGASIPIFLEPHTEARANRPLSAQPYLI